MPTRRKSDDDANDDRVDPTGIGSRNPNELGEGDRMLDYNAEQTQYSQWTPAQDNHTAMLGLAGALRNNTNAANNNLSYQRNGFYGGLQNQHSGLLGDYGSLNQALQSMYQGQNGLQRGPQNAFSPSMMRNMTAQGANALAAGNRNTMMGFANSNAGRGVAGSSLGGILGQQMAVQNSGALANQAFNSNLQGRQQGLNEYNARGQVAGGLGSQMGTVSSRMGGLESAISAQDQRDWGAYNNEFQSRQEERQNAFLIYDHARQALANFNNTYAIQMSAPPGGENGDDIKESLRIAQDNLIREMNLARTNYQQYGNQSNPNQTTTIQNRAT